MRKAAILVAAIFIHTISVFAQAPEIQKYGEIINKEPDLRSATARVWHIKKTEILRINLVEFTGEMALHRHPDAVHSFLILEGEARVMAGDSTFTMHKGDFISIPTNLPHKLWPITRRVYIVSMDAPYYDPAKTIRIED